jgi:uncharacterized protein YggE
MRPAGDKRLISEGLSVTRIHIAAAFAAVVALGVPNLALALAQEPGAAGPRDRTILVLGSGRVSADPDMAVLTVPVSAEGSFAQDAVNAVRSKLRHLTAALREAGVAEADIGQSAPQLSPRFSSVASAASPQILPSGGAGVPTPLVPSPPHGPSLQRDGFIASVTLTIRTRALETIGELTDRVADGDDGHLPTVALIVEDPQKYVDAARRKALDDAAHSAELEAERMHLKLGAVRAIRDQLSQDRVIELLEKLGEARLAGASDLVVAAAPGSSRASQVFLVNLEVEWAVEP